MTNCKDCKHWDNDAVEWHKPFGFCSSAKWVGGYHVKEATLASDMCHHEDDEGWGFVTGPDFGCIHGESR